MAKSEIEDADLRLGLSMNEAIALHRAREADIAAKAKRDRDEEMAAICRLLGLSPGRTGQRDDG